MYLIHANFLRKTWYDVLPTWSEDVLGDLDSKRSIAATTDHASANDEAFAFDAIHDVTAKNQDKEGIPLDQY